MKVLKWPEFAALGCHVLFSFCDEYGNCTDLALKHETISLDGDPRDFFFHPLIAQRKMGADADNTPEVTYLLERWGEYNYDQLFAVYEFLDMEIILSAVNACHGKAEAQEIRECRTSTET